MVDLVTGRFDLQAGTPTDVFDVARVERGAGEFECDPSYVTPITGRVVDAANLLKRLDAEGGFVAIGHSPATELFKSQLELDDSGYIVNDTTVAVLRKQALVLDDERRGAVVHLEDEAGPAHFLLLGSNATLTEPSRPAP